MGSSTALGTKRSSSAPSLEPALATRAASQTFFMQPTTRRRADRTVFDTNTTADVDVQRLNYCF